MRAILATIAVLALSVPAQAWQFTLDADRGQYLGEVFQRGSSGSEIGARCFSDYRDERELYLTLDARLEGRRPEGTVPVTVSSSAGTVTVAMQPTRNRGRLSLVASSYDDPAVLQVIQIAAGASGGLTVEVLDAVATFQTGDASAAFRGFQTICTSLPRADSPFSRPGFR